METNDLIKMFERSSDINDWGTDAYILLYNDGSGEVCSEDNDTLFEFNNIDELIAKLEE